MSSLAFLVTELQSLSSETRRKHPEVREAAEKSLAILRSSPEQATVNLASDGPQSEDLLRPVFMGCATKNAKVVAISLGSLQRLIALKAVPHSAVPLIINTMSDCVNQGVDIQLRILQTLLSLITNFRAVHGALLGDALLLCFKLQESRIAVVSSTAAATLRQLVMFVVDKVMDEDRRAKPTEEDLEEIHLPNGTLKKLGPSARDSFAVFEDLCLLANSEKPNFLRLDFLHKTFALELIESVLTNYHDLFRKHTELILLLQHHLCPLLLKGLSERPLFPLTLRSTRVVFLLLKQFSTELQTESEVFLMLLIKIVGGGGEPDSVSSPDFQQPHGSRPTWMRVLAMEVMRGLCSDSDLMRNVWNRYDAEESGSKVFSSLVTALKRLVTEKPALLGVGPNLFGVGASSGIDTNSAGYGLDVGGVAGMVATAASATMSGVVGMMGPEAGLSIQGSAMKLQCIDQLDKADSPPIPEAYVYLLGVQCLVSLCEGFSSFTGPVYTSFLIQKPKAAGESIVRAPAALDLSQLPPDDPVTKQLRTVRDMVANGWPALLAALSFVISTNLSDDLFVDVLASYQAMTKVSGMLALTTPRDAFFTSLAKLAVPARVVSSLDSHGDLSAMKTSQSITENLGLTGPSQAPGLSDRNLACLKVFVSSALFLAGSLGESWFDILEVLQNADYILTAKGLKMPTSRRNQHGSTNVSASRSVSTSSTASTAGTAASSNISASQQTFQHALLSDVDAESVQAAIQRLFDASKNLEDPAFRDFVNALCKLSGEMVVMQSTEGSELLLDSVESPVSMEEPMSSSLSPRIHYAQAHRRRVSGIHLPRTLRSGDFGINKLGGVSLLNIHRLIYRPPEVAWNTITAHLLSIIRQPTAPQHIRIQAARILDEILVVVPRNLSSTGEMKSEIQQRVLDVLFQQIVFDSNAIANNTSVELRKMGLETLHLILQSSGHTLVVGWDTIFVMLSSVCKPATPPSDESTDSVSTVFSTGISRVKPPPLGYVNEKGYTTLVKIAFQSLTLVCDSVTSFSPDNLRLCISTLGQFGKQADTNIALTAAESLLWSVSDSIQTKRKDLEKEPEYSALWMFLLLEVLGLCTDARPEVRIGAIQTLFRTLQLYGGTLSLYTWDECIWKVIFPLLDSITMAVRPSVPSPASPLSVDSSSNAWDESKSLALQSIGSIFSDFLVSKIMHLDSFSDAWNVFLSHIRESWMKDNRSITTPSLRCLEKATSAFSNASEELKDKIIMSSERVWETCDCLGGVLSGFSSDNSQSIKPFTQECLMAFVDVINCTRVVSRKLRGVEWSLERLTRLTIILKDSLTYQYSPEYRPDIDTLSPVQTVVLDTIHDIDLSVPGAASLILRDLSEYATLPFLAAFDVQQAQPPSSAVPQKRVTYIALSKKVMPLLVELFLRFKRDTEIYSNGTLEAILAAYAIPVKLKYDCPPPSKHGKDQPLWKTATTGFLHIVKEFCSQIRKIGEDIPADRIESIWRQVLEVFRGGILADCSAADSFPPEVREAEENFDLALIASLEIDVIPHLGESRVPDYLILQLGKILHLGSKLREYQDPRPSSPPPRNDTSTKTKKLLKKDRFSDSFEQIDAIGDRNYEIGTTDSGISLPRERFSYWCFDLLFLICSDTAKDWESSRQRVASLCIPMLLSRCRSSLIGFVADEELRGSLPFPRSREEELLYILQKLLHLQLWPGTLWAALSESPSANAVEQPPIKASLAPRVLIMDAVQRSPKAHLFQFYHIFYEMASIPRRSPSAWMVSSSINPKEADGSRSIVVLEESSPSKQTTELDARSLARESLRQIGIEMGLPR